MRENWKKKWLAKKKKKIILQLCLFIRIFDAVFLEYKTPYILVCCVLAMALRVGYSIYLLNILNLMVLLMFHD